MDAKQGKCYKPKERNKDCDNQFPTPNAMLDVWWLLVKSNVEDGAGVGLPKLYSGESGKRRRSAAYLKEQFLAQKVQDHIFYISNFGVN